MSYRRYRGTEEQNISGTEAKVVKALLRSRAEELASVASVSILEAEQNNSGTVARVVRQR